MVRQFSSRSSGRCHPSIQTTRFGYRCFWLASVTSDLADKRSVRSAALLNIAAQTWREARARLPEDASEEERLALIETVIAAFPEIDAALKKMEPGADEGDDGSAGGEF
jgi:hypothetical protein